MKKFTRKFVALAAPSGGGKTTLCHMLLKKYRDTTLSISFTTRQPRGQEKNGVEYNFVGKKEFENLIHANELVEWAEVHGNFYGTSKAFMQQQSAQGKVVLLDIDVQGVESLKRVFGHDCMSVFIMPPNMEILEQRLRARNTESEEKIQKRLQAAKEEISAAKDFDFTIINKDLDQSFRELCALVEREVPLAN